MPVQSPSRSKRISTDFVAAYRAQGFCLLRDALPVTALDDMLEEFLSLVANLGGRAFADAHSPELVAYFNEHPQIESEAYTRIRRSPCLLALAQHPAVVEPVKQLLGESCGVFAKAPFRIDMPLWTKELALWHQDHFYVRGNTDIVTAWIPFQDTTYFNGCLSVMPGSHALGPLPHDAMIGKKSVPSSIFNREIRMVEMNKGDVLLFNALLLHTGNLNYSESIRYSLQPRYTPLAGAVDLAMGEVVPL